jgi:hypothetical protein
MNVSFFTTSNWASASLDERRDALQGLENFFAGVQGRVPRTVIVDNLDKGVMGQYSPRKSASICISRELLKNNAGNFMAMDTIIHEGRHAYQDDCIMWLCSPHSSDVLSVGGWRENMPGRGGVYFSSGFSYRYQPVEADAHRYASLQMDALKDTFGDDSNYIAYYLNREAEDDYHATKANNTLGENFMEIIAQDVSDGFTRLCLAGLGVTQTAGGGDFIGNGGGIMAISTAELVAKIRSLQNSSEQLSAVVANASQELVRQANFLAQLTRGSRSGEEATGVIQTSSQSLNRAATTLKSLCQAGDEYIQNATK